MSSGFNTNKKAADKQKLRGGYYTPVELAQFLVNWAIRDGTEHILEPSAGDGNFLVALIQHSEQFRAKEEMSVVAVEIDEEEISTAQERVKKIPHKKLHVSWICADFFEAYESLKQRKGFDVVLGNPPFIRFQYFEDKSRERAFSHLQAAGYRTTKLANAWAAFIQLSIELLQDGGRLAMVVPAELLQVKYSEELRARLSRQFEHIVLIGFKKLVFPEIQQEVLLLLAEGKRTNGKTQCEIHTVQFEDGHELIQQGYLSATIAHVPAKHTRNGMKWTALFLRHNSFEALDEAEQSSKLTPLGQLAEVDVGIVTGRNRFFVLSEEMRNQIAATDFSVPLVGRTSALKSIVFDLEDFDKYRRIHPAYLLNLSGIDVEDFPSEIVDYLHRGQQEGVHTGYKCRVRPRWHDVPSVYVPDAFLFRQVHKYPLLVINRANAVSTDTIHRVRFKSNIEPMMLAAVFFNSLTLAWSEVGGRSYGGGVLELETREAEELPIPYNENLSIDPHTVNSLLRQGKIETALNYVDQIVLKDYLGFDNIIVRNIRAAWVELRDRRINRK